MKRLLALAFLAVAIVAHAADPAADSLTGHYELAKKSKSFLTFDVLQKGKSATTSFSAAHVDGSGAAPDGDGQGALNAKGELEFQWTDTFDNAGTGTLRREGKLYRLSLKPTKVNEPRAVVFYDDLTLKRTSTKPQMSAR